MMWPSHFLEVKVEAKVEGNPVFCQFQLYSNRLLIHAESYSPCIMDRVSSLSPGRVDEGRNGYGPDRP